MTDLFFFVGFVGIVTIITGRGNHSENHQPKIKPKIIEYLEGKKYK